MWQSNGSIDRSAKRGGRPRTVNVREILNAIFYLLSTGCQWADPPMAHWIVSTMRCTSGYASGPVVKPVRRRGSSTRKVSRVLKKGRYA